MHVLRAEELVGISVLHISTELISVFSCAVQDGPSVRMPDHISGTGRAGDLYASYSALSVHQSGQTSSHIPPSRSDKASLLKKKKQRNLNISLTF